MKEYTACVVIASMLLIWWVQPSKSQYGYGLRPMAPINCKGNRCPGGEVTDPPEDDGAADSGGAPREGKPEPLAESPQAPAPAPAPAPAEVATPAPEGASEAPASEAPATEAATEAPPARK